MIWPLPALLTWAAAWLLFEALGRSGAPLVASALAAVLLGALLASLGSTRWRRLFIAAGFPLSLLVSGAASSLPAWAWLLPLALLLLLYPLDTWRDAPLFPTPADALRGLEQVAPLAPGARIVDAGSGLGAGLLALKRAYPQAHIEGLEWSWPLVLASRLRCGFAHIARADIWVADWSTFDLVYLFQRPESMPRAVDKALRELPPGAWLVSLEFEATALAPVARLEPVPGKPVWVYRMPAGAVPSTNAATSLRTGAIQRKGAAIAPTSVRWLALA
jgi:SAM-dependent methyltransferase